MIQGQDEFTQTPIAARATKKHDHVLVEIKVPRSAFESVAAQGVGAIAQALVPAITQQFEEALGLPVASGLYVVESDIREPCITVPGRN